MPALSDFVTFQIQNVYRHAIKSFVHQPAETSFISHHSLTLISHVLTR